MELRGLGSTGVQVSPLCLGAMMFGAWGKTDHDESIAIIHRALDAGINFIDTADVYSRGESEEIVGKALAGGRRDNVILATKVHGTMGDDPNQFGNSRRWIIREVENSLRRLKTDWIDLYQIHRPEPDTDIDETLGALTDLVRAGQGPLHRLLDVPAEPDRRGAVGGRAPRPRALRAASSRPTRCSSAASRPTCCPTCPRYGMGVIPWSPLAGGWLCGRYRKGQDAEPHAGRAMLPKRYDMSIPGNQRKLDAADALAQLAEEAGHQPDRDGAGLRHPPSGRDRGDHRAADDGAPRVAARRPSTSSSPTTSSTGSTRSCRRAPTSIRPIPAGTARTSRRRPAGADPVSSDARKKFCPQASKGAERTTQLAVTRRV